jgi:hypothetical protein
MDGKPTNGKNRINICRFFGGHIFWNFFVSLATLFLKRFLKRVPAGWPENFFKQGSNKAIKRRYSLKYGKLFIKLAKLF